MKAIMVNEQGRPLDDFRLLHGSNDDDDDESEWRIGHNIYAVTFLLLHDCRVVLLELAQSFFFIIVEHLETFV